MELRFSVIFFGDFIGKGESLFKGPTVEKIGKPAEIVLCRRVDPKKVCVEPVIGTKVCSNVEGIVESSIVNRVEARGGRSA